MKRIFLVIGLTFLLLGGRLFSQMQFSKVGEKVSVKGQYAFNIVTNGYSSEVVINNSLGNTLLAFIPFKIQNGWKSESSNSISGMFSKSGTSFTYFYRVASTSGDYCDIPVTRLYNSYNLARFVISFGLVKNDALDKTAFDQFCGMHGKVYDDLKYFK